VRGGSAPARHGGGIHLELMTDDFADGIAFRIGTAKDVKHQRILFPAVEWFGFLGLNSGMVSLDCPEYLRSY